jgi:hypothetical protein
MFCRVGLKKLPEAISTVSTFFYGNGYFTAYAGLVIAGFPPVLCLPSSSPFAVITSSFNFNLFGFFVRAIIITTSSHGVSYFLWLFMNIFVRYYIT